MPVKKFLDRHLGPSEQEISLMLKEISAKDLDDVIRLSIPDEVLNVPQMNFPEALSESQMIQRTRDLASQNKVFKNYIGCGFYESLPLSVLNRHIIKNPVWYTPYTPYQAELAQGRLEALLNFQTLIMDITGMDIANASLLDEASAAAEAVSMAFNHSSSKNKKLFVDTHVWGRTLSVLYTHAKYRGFEIQEGSIEKDNVPEDTTAVFFQYPFSDGRVEDLKVKIQKLKEQDVCVISSTDLLACCLIQPPGEWGADITVGSTGRLGLPLFYGGPHAAFLAAKKEFKQEIPGRIVGISQDRHGKKAVRLALQTREQHIRRERATSNICTAQALPAVLAVMYAIYHGRSGLKNIARTIHQNTLYLYKNLKHLGLKINSSFFDTLNVQMEDLKKKQIKLLSEKQKINLGSTQKAVIISVGEGRDQKDMDELISIFKKVFDSGKKLNSENIKQIGIPKGVLRSSSFLDHPVFHQYQSETKLIRYIHYLQGKDLSLAHSMIPLGSCTMKLNATTELQPMTWKPFSDIHPYCPKNQVQGTLKIFKELSDFLSEMTGFSNFSLQPSAGSQGELLGLMIFQEYHRNRGNHDRNVCLIPTSAHGTNPASARMAGLKIASVKCQASGEIDLEDLKSQIKKYSKTLSSVMLTYPSTLGIFEKNIVQICHLVHQAGGLVYFDGANMNALAGLSRPADFGFDAGHLNLHKTFCIPHGGGGPGAGPLGVVKKLAPFLPKDFSTAGDKNSLTLSSSPFGNAGILSVPWAYIRMMGFEGLKKASQVAILNANYIRKKLEPHYRILFTGMNGYTAHECIIDLRRFKYSAEVDVSDVAKRLMDYGFHAPTMSWPIPGTFMIEPTESEDKQEIDRFCSSLIEIRKEISEIENKKVSLKNNLLKNAPHTMEDIKNWSFDYSIKKACFPLPYLNDKKFWPSVSRINESYGDINLFCSCPPVESPSMESV